MKSSLAPWDQALALVFSNEVARVAKGVAIVPIHVFDIFHGNPGSYLGLLEVLLE